MAKIKQFNVYQCKHCQRFKATEGKWVRLTSYETMHVVDGEMEQKLKRIKTTCPECKEK